MNRLVYPVRESRFLADARARMPDTRVLPFATGARYTVVGKDVELDERAGIVAGLVDPRADEDLEHAGGTDFRPLEVPAVVDPNLDGRGILAIRTTCEAWVSGALVRALAKAWPAGEIRYLLEVVWPGGMDVYAVAASGGEATLERTTDPSWDVRCVVAGSMLCDVIEAKRPWGDLLLGGTLRGCSRAHSVDARGVRELGIQPLFLYAAISYEESVENALEATINRIVRRVPS